MSSDKAPEKVVRWVGADHSINYSDGRYQPRGEVVYVRHDLVLLEQGRGIVSIQSAIIKTWLESDISRRRGQINSVIVSQETFMALKKELYNMQRYSELSKIRGLAMVLPGNHDVCDVYFAPYFEGIAFCERVELEFIKSKEGES